MAFQQAAIKVEKEQEFGKLKSAIERIFARAEAEKFLRKVHSTGLRVRDLEPILARGILEQVDRDLTNSRETGQGLYEALSVSDRAQVREFYLFQVERVEPAWRAKFKKIYQYY